MAVVWVRTFVQLFSDDKALLGWISLLFVTPGSFVMSWYADPDLGRQSLFWLGLGAALLVLASLISVLDGLLARRRLVHDGD